MATSAPTLTADTTASEKQTQGAEKTNDDPSPQSAAPAVVLATSQNRWVGKPIPSFVSYGMTFLAFPLNMMAGGFTLFTYGIFFTNNLYLRSFCLVYTAWMALIDSKRCDGIGYPCHNTWPFTTLRRWVRNNWLYAAHCSYYPITLHKTAELPATITDPKTKEPQKQQYLFTCHPHGVIGVGTMATFATDEVGFKKLYPGLETYMTGLRQVFYTPLFRDWCMLGGIYSADRSSFHHIFTTKQESAVVNLGGAAEAFIGLGTNPATGNTVMKLLLKDRKGFCKLALQYGVSIVPVITFEEHLLFDLLKLSETGGGVGGLLYKFQLYLQKQVIGFAPVLFWGNLWPLMPKRHPLNVFVGKPIACPRIAKPTQTDIDATHDEYCRELVDMFHKFKKLVKGCEDWELELIEHPFKKITKM